MCTYMHKCTNEKIFCDTFHYYDASLIIIPTKRHIGNELKNAFTHIHNLFYLMLYTELGSSYSDSSSSSSEYKKVG